MDVGVAAFCPAFWLLFVDNDGGMVYDNGLGDADDGDAATAIGGGSIVIHKTKTK